MLPMSGVSALVDAVATAAQSAKVMVSIKHSARAGAIGGGSIMAGALLGGPVGLVIGGLVGTAAAYMTSSDLKPLHQAILEDLTTEQRAKLGEALWSALTELNPGTVTVLATLITQGGGIRDKAIQVATDFVTGAMKG